MATMIFDKRFLEFMDAIDEQINMLIAEKARLLLAELELDAPRHLQRFEQKDLLVFEVPDIGVGRQLNKLCFNKSRLRFDYRENAEFLREVKEEV